MEIIYFTPDTIMFGGIKKEGTRKWGGIIIVTIVQKKVVQRQIIKVV